MSYQYVQLGNPLQLELILPDGNTGFFPQATVFDSVGVPVAGSPFNLSSQGLGLYVNRSYVPLAGNFSSVYIVYSDAGRTILAVQYGRSSDHFQVDALVTQSIQNTTNVTAIKGKTDQLNYTGTNVNAQANVVTDKSGYALSPASQSAVANEVWDVTLASHLTIGSTGKALDQAGSVSSAVIANAVWDQPRASNNMAGSFGQGSQGVLSVVRADRLDNLDATISSRASQVSLNVFQQDVDDSFVATDALINTRQSSATALSQFTTLNTNILDTKAAVLAIPLPPSASTVANAVWDTIRSTRNLSGSFGEALQGVLSVARANLLDNLTNLDTLVSSRSSQTTVDTINTNVNTLLTRLTAPRAANLDNLDTTVSSRATQISVNALPILSSIVGGVWNASLGSYTLPGSTGEALATAGAGGVNPVQIADAVWNALKSSYTLVGSFGSLLDTSITSRSSDADMQSVKGAGFVSAQSSLAAIRTKINTLPTSAGDATLANQNTIIATLANKANQNTLLSVQSAVAAIPLNPLLTNDPRLNNIDATISSRATQTSVNDIAGAGFNTATDSLVAIRAAVNATVDLTPVLTELSLIQGVGFSTTTDSLVAVRSAVNATKASADAAQTAALAAQAAALAASSQASVNAIAVQVAAIPTNPALASDPRFNTLDANISTRSTQTSVNSIQGVGFSSSANSLVALTNLVNSKTYGDATAANQTQILAAISLTALQTTLIQTQGFVQVIPTNPLLTNDPRLNFINVPLSTLADKNDIQSIQGAGFNTATDSLYAISVALSSANLNLTPVLTQLTIIKGAGFLPVNDNLHNIQTTATDERAQIFQNTQACLSRPEPT